MQGEIITNAFLVDMIVFQMNLYACQNEKKTDRLGLKTKLKVFFGIDLMMSYIKNTIKPKVNRNTTFLPFLISLAEPAVTTPPEYKCTCRSQSFDYCTASISLMKACSNIAASPLLCY